jgi:hypothetical protein
VNAHLAADAPFEVDLAPLLRPLDDAAVDLQERDAIDRADLQARFAPGAVVGVDHRQLFRNLFGEDLVWPWESRELRVKSQKTDAIAAT